MLGILGEREERGREGGREGETDREGERERQGERERERDMEREGERERESERERGRGGERDREKRDTDRDRGTEHGVCGCVWGNFLSRCRPGKTFFSFSAPTAARRQVPCRPGVVRFS